MDCSRNVKFVFSLVAFLFLLFAVLFFSFLRLTPQSERTSFVVPTLTQEQKAEIKTETSNLTTDKELFDYAVKKAASMLQFSACNNIRNNSANCIGYAALSKSYLNYALQIHGKSNKTYHYVGIVSTCGINLNKILKFFLPIKHKSFVKDHDFIGMETDNGAVLLASPTLYDLIGNQAFTLIE